MLQILLCLISPFLFCKLATNPIFFTIGVSPDWHVPFRRHNFRQIRFDGVIDHFFDGRSLGWRRKISLKLKFMEKRFLSFWSTGYRPASNATLPTYRVGTRAGSYSFLILFDSIVSQVLRQRSSNALKKSHVFWITVVATSGCVLGTHSTCEEELQTYKTHAVWIRNAGCNVIISPTSDVVRIGGDSGNTQSCDHKYIRYISYKY